MYKKQATTKSYLRVNQSAEGETIEQKVTRITTNKEPITDGAPLIYTDRSKGVEPAYDIRTDRFEVALEAMDAVSRAQRAKGEGKGETPVVKMEDKTGEKEGGEPDSNSAT